MSPRPKIRCAIYTRKSSDEGLEQEFNSLDAQAEACAAYVASQRHEGWKLLPDRYDDGGLSGGTLDRPALQRLMNEIAAGRVDMVVVYKIDRLTRSLTDFAKLVETLDAAGCSFVSVTQAFNTSTSMGRLTLNVLLSFAQFEREVTAERIRDKIAASKKKGLWMGGSLPLGYDRDPDPQARTLVINPDEARTVQRLFALHAELGCLREVAAAAAREGLRSKRHVRADGTVTGDRPLSRGQIYYLLRNPVYRGQIRHKDKVWPGQHPPIIDAPLWTRVQDLLLEAANRPRTRDKAFVGDHQSWLIGKLRDETGDRLTPTHTSRRGRRIRYYVSNRLISGGRDPSGWRLPGEALEHTVADLICTRLRSAANSHGLLAEPDAAAATEIAAQVDALLADVTPGDCGAFIAAGTIARGEITLDLDLHALAARLDIPADHLAPALARITCGFQLRRRGVETKIVAGERRPAPDETLLAMLRRAHGWTRALRSGAPLSEIARREGLPGSFIRTRAQLAFLSPKIQAAILAGTQPPELSLTRILSRPVPLEWSEQERLLGFDHRSDQHTAA